MSAHGSPTLQLPKLEAPGALIANVSRRGQLLLRERVAVRVPHRRGRKLVVDVSLAGFCLVHLVWCAHVVGLIP